MAKDTTAALAATAEYQRFVEALKTRVRTARISAARHINRDLILLYWDIGHGIVEKQRVLGWGDAVVEMVATDLRRAFPDVRGFSAQNVWRMKQLYVTYTDKDFLSQAVSGHAGRTPVSSDLDQLSQVVRELVAQVPWGHHANALAKIATPASQPGEDVDMTGIFPWCAAYSSKDMAVSRATYPST